MTQQLSLTPTSGTTLDGYDAEAVGRELGALEPIPTSDGSLSLQSGAFGEAFHNSAGALNEAQSKFVRPSELNAWSPPGALRVLDVCFGLGYNSAALWDADSAVGLSMQWWGLELDQRPLQLALNHEGFCRLWSASTRSRLQGIERTGTWSDHSGKGCVLWGDARQTLASIPATQQFDLIFHDAFSPQRCPQLWSEEFLGQLSDRLAPEGRLLTYSRSAAVRASLQRAGLLLRSLLPAPGEREGWSSGTMAIKPPWPRSKQVGGEGWRCFSPLEQAHLLTRAAIPFRDPSGHANASDILKRRVEEQQTCGLETTNSWQRRFGLMKPKRAMP